MYMYMHIYIVHLLALAYIYLSVRLMWLMLHVLTQGLFWLFRLCQGAVGGVQRRGQPTKQVRRHPTAQRCLEGPRRHRRVVARERWVCGCVSVYWGARGCFTPPSPLEIAFPTFNMGLPPSICICLLNCLPPLEQNPEINPVKVLILCMSAQEYVGDRRRVGHSHIYHAWVHLFTGLDYWSHLWPQKWHKSVLNLALHLYYFEGLIAL